MSRLAVKDYLITKITAAQAAIIANTTTFTSVITLRQVPKLEKLGTGFFVITGPSTNTQTRLSGSRGAGQKKNVYRMRVWAYGIAKDEHQGGDDFDIAWDNLLHVFETIAVQVGITDPITGGQSWIHDIGELIEETVEEPETAAPQGLVRFRAEAFVTIEEIINNV